MENKLILSSSPQWRDTDTIPKIMNTVSLSLIPAWLISIYFFGFPAVYLTLLAILSAVGTEYCIERIFKLPSTIRDGSAIVTGVLLGFNLPPGVPFWIPIIGSMVAIGVGKMVFGGLGNNPINPALIGRAFLMASWPIHMTSAWRAPRGGSLSSLTSNLESLTTATPLNLYKSSMDVIRTVNDPTQIKTAQDAVNSLSTNWLQFFLGQTGGCLGETSALAILLGALYLIYKNYVDWRIPFSYILTVGLLGWALGGFNGLFSGSFLFHVFAGGLFLGAFYMATDMVTSPLTRKGKVIFGIGCGIITFIIRMVGGYPEGVCYSILLMNLAVPLIDRYIVPRKFGEVIHAK
ncbi:MAG: RnfABCDGE type electron transport complex subunit D [Candidatus Delongbacteria bacterium]|nr:RnfABCDGE type electron transport complex subunit D [Candidatus Delongbacteria bacterium]